MDIKVRCNDMLDCDDGSDEKNCEHLLINEDSYKRIMPDYSKGCKTKIEVIAELEAVTEIDQLAMTFHGDIKIILRWRDGRIKFKDIGNGTFLNKEWRDKIWLPPLYFSNTIGKKPLSTDEGFVVKVLKQGELKCNDVSVLNEGYETDGDQNDLELTSHYDYVFHCTFALSRFPFDTQNCSMILKIPSEMAEYVEFDEYNISYHFSGEDFS